MKKLADKQWIGALVDLILDAPEEANVDGLMDIALAYMSNFSDVDLVKEGKYADENEMCFLIEDSLRYWPMERDEIISDPYAEDYIDKSTGYRGVEYFRTEGR